MNKIIFLMILVRKIQLVKFLFFIVIARSLLLIEEVQLINLLNANEEEKSAFSVLKKNIYGTEDKDLLIVKQTINEGEMKIFNSAKIRLLNYNTGISTEYEIRKDEDYKYSNNINIILHDCQKEKGEVLNPVNMALILIKNNAEIIFNNWIFSKNSSLSLPKIDENFIYLSECVNKITNEDILSNE